ncbi:MAG: MFS transporter [Opitutaceae bacterium]|nr:MFS transporter [Opitutaceae bacterium]
MPSPDPSPEADCSQRTRAIYGLGGMFDRIGSQGLKDLGNPIYNLVLAINPVTIGFIFVVTRLWDAFIDPLMGSISDNTRTRWGRRRPYMLAGTVLAALAILPIFWMPANLGPAGTAAWMLVTGLVFFTAFTIFDIPYRALAYELAPGYHGKTRILAARTLFTMVAAAVVPWIFPLTQSGWLGEPRDSLPWISVGLAVLILVSGLVPTFFLREPPATRTGEARRRVPFRESFVRTVKCQPFRRLLSMGACTIVGVNLGFGFGTYVIIYHVYGGDRAAAAATLGWFGTAFVGVALFAVPLMSALARRVGKRDALSAALVLSCVGAVASWWLFSPSHPWTVFLGPVLLAPGMICLWMLGESMVADVCDVETLRTGESAEAMFSSVFAWVLKTATALSILGSNLLLNLVGFDVALGSAQPPDTVWWMRVIYVALPAVGFVGSLLFLAGHRLGAAEMCPVHRELAQKRRDGEI